MRIKRLVVTDFRNIERKEVVIPDGEHVIAVVGPNGIGKTSLLEAMSVLDGGKGMLGAEGREQVRQGTKNWGVFVELDGGVETVGVGYRPEGRGGRREVKVDGIEAKVESLAGVGKILSLVPALDRVFFESPGERRGLLDEWAAQVDVGHGEAVARYVHHARGRLRILCGGDLNSDWLEAEEQQAAVWGIALLRGRQAYVDGLKDELEAVGLRLKLKGAALEVLADGDPVAALKGKFERSREIDARMERTHAGPNTLDLQAELFMNEKWVVASMASSGQHKRVLLRWLAGQVRRLTVVDGEAPLVLVDEFGAHLDAAGRGQELAMLQGLGAQVWLSDVLPVAGFAVEV